MTTMNELFDRYERECLPKLSPRTQKDYTAIINRLRGTFGHRDCLDIKPRDIGRFLDVDKGKVSANRHVSVLSAVFSKAVGRWYIHDDLRNPCQRVERNETKRRTRYISNAEYEAFYAIACPSIQIAMDLALLTGQRQGDLLRLTWHDIDTTQRLVHFKQGKTGKRLAVEVTKTLEDVLVRARRLPPRLPRMHLVRTRTGEPYTSEGFRAMWQRFMRKALSTGVLKERFTFHDIRAKCVSDSGSLNEAMERAGHTSMAMTRGTYDRGIRKVKALR